MTPTGVGIIAFFGIVMVLAGWFTAPKSAERATARLAARTGLDLDKATAGLVRRRLRRRVRGSILGGGVGLVLGLLAILARSGPANLSSWAAAALLVGFGVGALVDSGQAGSEPGSRAAVLRRRRLTDFLLPVEVAAPFAALLLPVLAVVLAAARVRAAPEPVHIGLLVATVCVTLAVTAVATLAQRFVLGMSPPADSPLRLQWEDALRGIALRDIGITAYGVSYVLSGLVAFDIPDLLRGAPGTAIPTAVLFVTATVGLIWLAVTAEGRTAPVRRFLRLYDYDATTAGGHK